MHLQVYKSIKSIRSARPLDFLYVKFKKQLRMTRLLAAMHPVLQFIFQGPHNKPRGATGNARAELRSREAAAAARKLAVLHYERRQAIQRHIDFKINSTPLFDYDHATIRLGKSRISWTGDVVFFTCGHRTIPLRTHCMAAFCEMQGVKTKLAEIQEIMSVNGNYASANDEALHVLCSKYDRVYYASDLKLMLGYDSRVSLRDAVTYVVYPAARVKINKRDATAWGVTWCRKLPRQPVCAGPEDLRLI